jgi:hypothetical protein
MHRSAALLALALAALPAPGEDRVVVKTKHAEGDAFDVRISMKVRIAGSVQGQAISTKHEGVEEYREKTLAIEDGRPVRAERTYKAREQTLEQKLGEMPPQVETKKNPLVGQTVVLVRKAGKVELEAKPEGTEIEDDDLDFGTDDFDVLLPDGAVAVGDEWTLGEEKLKAMFGEDGPKASEATCKLEEVAEKGGAKVARIAVKITLKGEEDGAQVSGELTGPFLFDLSANRPLSVALKGTIKVAMQMATLEGPMELESTVTAAK